MKDAVIPQIRVESELRSNLDAVLVPGETLTEFVGRAVRNAVEFRRVQTDFASRCEASLAEYDRTGRSVLLDSVLGDLEAKVAARVKQLTSRRRSRSSSRRAPRPICFACSTSCWRVPRRSRKRCALTRWSCSFAASARTTSRHRRTATAGRGARPTLRELIIPFGATGHVLRFDIRSPELVVVIGARHQREEDFH